MICWWSVDKLLRQLTGCRLNVQCTWVSRATDSSASYNTRQSNYTDCTYQSVKVLYNVVERFSQLHHRRGNKNCAVKLVKSWYPIGMEHLLTYRTQWPQIFDANFVDLHRTLHSGNSCRSLLYDCFYWCVWNRMADRPSYADVRSDRQSFTTR